jgi:FkbM family methyltransferase
MITRVNLYRQEPEARLLCALLSALERQQVIDVGAERGAFVEALLDAGADEVYAVEPEPGNADFMRKHFESDPRVRVLEYAASDADGQLQLHRSVGSSGEPVTFGHTVLDRPDTEEIAWRETVTVTARTLASLIDAGELPRQAGILKIDTEGHDLAVVAGMGDLDCDVVMVEHWTDLPNSLGRCPWTSEEIASALRQKGFSHFAFFHHHGEEATLKWDDAEVPTGDMGNLVFLHDRVVDHLLPHVLESASALADENSRRLGAKLAVLEHDRAARLKVIERLAAQLEQSEADRQARLETIERLAAQLEQSEADRQARLETFERLATQLERSETERRAQKETNERLEAALRRARRLVSRRWILEQLEAAGSAQSGSLDSSNTADIQVAVDTAAQHPARVDTANKGYEAEPGPSGLPKISVITPTCNGGELLEACVTSVLEQAYPNLEYIVIDGASTDGTLEILRRYDDKIAYWTSEPDNGQADAINKGFRRATGELVAWLNSDDFFYPGALAAAAEAYLADPVAPFYFGNGYRVDRTGRRIAEFFPDGQVHFRRKALVFGLNCVLQPATFIRLGALEQSGLLDESLHYGFDSDLWIRLSELGSPRPIRKHLAASREYEETKTSSGSFPRAEELRRIAERHAGVAATPGSTAYYLDTLHRLASSRPDVFPPRYLSAIGSFWVATAQLLSRYGARPDGFPIGEPGELAEPEPRPRRAGRRRIGIELRQVTRGESGGIVVVLVGTLLELFRRRLDLDFVVFCTVFNRELLGLDVPNVELITLPLHEYFAELRRLATERDVDVLIRSYPTVEDVDYPLRKQLFLLPDVQHIHHPEFFDPQSLRMRREAFQLPLERAGAIWTISEHAAQAIREIAADKCDVFVSSPSLPPDFLTARSEDSTQEEQALLPDGEFLLFPANLWGHKNHERLFEALRRFRRRTTRQVELVLTGSPSGWEELRARHQDLPVRHLGYVSPALMQLLYERTLALVYFSQYEGFGIPPLEAFAVGTPVICSNTTSLPEVAGDAALMCDPTDVDAICELMERIASDPGLRAELVGKGRQRLAAYTWDKAAEELAAGIERLLTGTGSPAQVDPHPLVSIVTPSYNQGHFIRRTIESVLAQSYPNIEYIVVDGASTDGTVDILRSYGDGLQWISEPDSGQSEAINKGISRARGEIVGYLNSDDVLLPHAIETVVDYFRKHPECDLVYGDADYIDVNDCVTGSYATADYSFERLMEDCCVCQPAAYWRKTVTKVVGPFDQTMQYAMDYDFWIRVDRSGFVIHHLREKIAQSRLHAETKTLTARRAIYREIFGTCRARGGYLSRSYVDGLWHHLVYERPYSPFRLLRLAPSLRKLLVDLHWRWLNRKPLALQDRLAQRVRAARLIVVRRLRRIPRVFALLVRTRARLRTLRGRHGPSILPSIEAATANGWPRVTGYCADNWLEPMFSVAVDARERSRQLRIVGQPVAAMTVEVSADGKQLGRFEVAPGRQQTVTVQLPPGPREKLSFSFSKHMVDSVGRKISFLLQETNTFREEDLLGNG